MNGRFISNFLLVTLFLWCAQTAAQTPAKKLLDLKACSACHKQSQKLIGPSWDAIKERYRAPNAQLARVVISGGSGSWGQVPMIVPKNVTVSPKEADDMLTYIFTGRDLVQEESDAAARRNVPQISVQSGPQDVSKVSTGPAQSIEQPNQQGERLTLESAKTKCAELGFKPATEAFGKCVLQLSKP
jgi:cytochrome c551/c552